MEDLMQHKGKDKSGLATGKCSLGVGALQLSRRQCRALGSFTRTPSKQSSVQPCTPIQCILYFTVLTLTVWYKDICCCYPVKSQTQLFYYPFFLISVLILINKFFENLFVLLQYDKYFCLLFTPVLMLYKTTSRPDKVIGPVLLYTPACHSLTLQSLLESLSLMNW